MSINISAQVGAQSAYMKKWCDERKKIWFVTSLYGSQNYGSDGPNSDVDTHTIILPNMAEILLEKSKESGTIPLNDGAMCYKDIHSMFDMYRKANVNFLETLVTPWYTCNPLYAEDWEQLRAGAELIVSYNPYSMYRTLKGYFTEQIDNYVKDHNYKALANAERLFYLTYFYFIEDTTYANAIKFNNNEKLQNANRALKFGQSFTNTKEETTYHINLVESFDKLCSKLDKMPNNGISLPAADFLNKMEAQLKLKVLANEMAKTTPK